MNKLPTWAIRLVAASLALAAIGCDTQPPAMPDLSHVESIVILAQHPVGPQYRHLTGQAAQNVIDILLANSETLADDRRMQTYGSGMQLLTMDSDGLPVHKIWLDMQAVTGIGGKNDPNPNRGELLAGQGARLALMQEIILTTAGISADEFEQTATNFQDVEWTDLWWRTDMP